MRRHLRLSGRRFSAGEACTTSGDERAPYYRWMFFTSGPIEFAVSNNALGFAVPPEREA